MAETRIVELRTDDEWRDAFPVMRQLRPALDEAAYLARLRAATEEGYRLFALVEEDSTPADRSTGGGIVALAGVVIRTNLFDGRHAWVDDLVTDADRRSEGHGGRLLRWVLAWARDHDCELVGLASGLQRDDAHRFYEARLGMERTAYVFKRRT